MTAGARVSEEREREIRDLLKFGLSDAGRHRMVTPYVAAIRDLLAALDQARAEALEEAAQLVRRAGCVVAIDAKAGLRGSDEIDTGALAAAILHLAAARGREEGAPPSTAPR